MSTDASTIDRVANEVAAIKKFGFKVSANILFGIAILSVIGRVVLKVIHRRKFSFDDYILFFGTGCLIAGTGVLRKELDDLYIGPAVQYDPSLIFLVDMKRLLAIVDDEIKYLDVFFALLWTATFSVKFSFLAFFHKLVATLKKLRIYYWITIVITVLSWGFIVTEPFIICPNFGWKSIQCFQNPKVDLHVALMGVGTTLDSLTDLMIVSIPIIILRRARMKLQQKFAIGTFLCLSIVMIIISIVRSSKMHGPEGVPIDVTWGVYWVHVEASIAVCMVSLTAFRTVFNQKREEEKRRERMKKPSSSFNRFRFRRNRRLEEDEITALPHVPRATMTGLKTFVRGSNRSESASTPEVSQNDTLKSADQDEILVQEEVVVKSVPHIHLDVEKDPWMTSPEWMHSDQNR